MRRIKQLKKDRRSRKVVEIKKAQQKALCGCLGSWKMNRPFLLPSACRRPIREHNCPWGPMSKRAEEPSQHVLLYTGNQRAH